MFGHCFLFLFPALTVLIRATVSISCRRSASACKYRPWAIPFSHLFAVEQVYEVLHGDEACPAVLLGDAERAGELPSVHRRGADIARFTALDDVMQRFDVSSIGVSW